MNLPSSVYNLEVILFNHSIIVRADIGLEKYEVLVGIQIRLGDIQACFVNTDHSLAFLFYRRDVKILLFYRLKWRWVKHLPCLLPMFTTTLWSNESSDSSAEFMFALASTRDTARAGSHLKWIEVEEEINGMWIANNSSAVRWLPMVEGQVGFKDQIVYKEVPEPCVV